MRYPQGAGCDNPFYRNQLQARKQLEKRADSPQSGARSVRQHGLTESTFRSDKCSGARLETRWASALSQTYCKQYDTIAGEKLQPFCYRLNTNNATIIYPHELT